MTNLTEKEFIVLTVERAPRNDWDEADGVYEDYRIVCRETDKETGLKCIKDIMQATTLKVVCRMALKTTGATHIRLGEKEVEVPKTLRTLVKKFQVELDNNKA